MMMSKEEGGSHRGAEGEKMGEIRGEKWQEKERKGTIPFDLNSFPFFQIQAQVRSHRYLPGKI